MDFNGFDRLGSQILNGLGNIVNRDENEIFAPNFGQIGWKQNTGFPQNIGFLAHPLFLKILVGQGVYYTVYIYILYTLYKLLSKYPLDTSKTEAHR